jgi:hypothetical protein
LPPPSEAPSEAASELDDEVSAADAVGSGAGDASAPGAGPAGVGATADPPDGVGFTGLEGWEGAGGRGVGGAAVPGVRVGPRRPPRRPPTPREPGVGARVGALARGPAKRPPTTRAAAVSGGRARGKPSGAGPRPSAEPPAGDRPNGPTWRAAGASAAGRGQRTAENQRPASERLSASPLRHTHVTLAPTKKGKRLIPVR